MRLRISGTVDESVVDGPGLRFVVFTQGCHHHCPGCQNPHTHDPEGGYDADTDELLALALSNPLLSGITLSGGEPFLQPVPLADLARKAKDAGLDVISYSGFTFEQILESPAAMELLREIDILVDGPFVEEKRSMDLKFRGSSNQRAIDVRESLATGHIVPAWEEEVFASPRP